MFLVIVTVGLNVRIIELEVKQEVIIYQGNYVKPV